mmetsp:Transcript_12438/g.33544  ORF Transcript_12438/g.33544 Transcript_12438/m.33544 type:complete len:202 (+) Transcript_12438:824-1429(+)
MQIRRKRTCARNSSSLMGIPPPPPPAPAAAGAAEVQWRRTGSSGTLVPMALLRPCAAASGGNGQGSGPRACPRPGLCGLPPATLDGCNDAFGGGGALGGGACCCGCCACGWERSVSSSRMTPSPTQLAALPAGTNFFTYGSAIRPLPSGRWKWDLSRIRSRSARRSELYCGGIGSYVSLTILYTRPKSDWLSKACFSMHIS